MLTEMLFLADTGLAPGLGEFVFATVVAFVVLALVASHLRFEQLAAKAASRDESEVPPHEGFMLQAASRLGSGTKNPPAIVMMALDPGCGDEWSAPHEAVLERVRGCVREADVVMPCGGGRVGLLLAAERSFSDGVVQRVFRALRSVTWKDDEGHERHLAPGAAVATCPENEKHATALIQMVSEALDRVMGARGSFGHELVPAPADEEVPGADATTRVPPYVDPLTGAVREERLHGVLQRFVANHRRTEGRVALVCLAVDQWSRYEEHYGQEGGQAILGELGKLLDHGVRTSDLIGRRGASGFVLGLVCSLQQAVAVAERLTEAVKKARFQTPGGAVRLTLSAGVAAYPEHGGVPQVLQDSAGVALEMAALRGPHTVCRYEKSMRSPTLADQPTDAL